MTIFLPPQRLKCDYSEKIMKACKNRLQGSGQGYCANCKHFIVGHHLVSLHLGKVATWFVCGVDAGLLSKFGELGRFHHQPGPVAGSVCVPSLCRGVLRKCVRARKLRSKLFLNDFIPEPSSFPILPILLAPTNTLRTSEG